MRGLHGRHGGDGECGGREGRHGFGFGGFGPGDRSDGRGHHRAEHMMRAMMAGGFGGPFGGPFGGGAGGFDGGRGGPGGRRGKRFTGEELRLMIVALLVEKPEHGYQLKRVFGERSGGAYEPSPGVLYPLLSLLEDEGMIERAEGDSGLKRRWLPTDAGHTEVEANRPAIDAAFERLASLAEVAGRTDNAPVRRAVHNMRAAIMERLGRETVDGELGFEVAKIIDEATQRIERL